MSSPNSATMVAERIGTRVSAVILGFALGATMLAACRDKDTVAPGRIDAGPRVVLVGNAQWSYDSAIDKKTGEIDYTAVPVKPDATIISEDGEGGLTAVNGSGNPVSMDIKLPTEDSRNSRGLQGRISSVEFIDPESGEEITLTEDGQGGLDAVDPQGNQVMETFHVPLAGPDPK